MVSYDAMEDEGKQFHKESLRCNLLQSPAESFAGKTHRCDCGASLAGEVWADQGMCQVCWEKHCSDELWRQLDEFDAALGSLVLFGLAWGVSIGIGFAVLIAWLIG
jgi:hypothetical protein